MTLSASDPSPLSRGPSDSPAPRTRADPRSADRGRGCRPRSWSLAILAILSAGLFPAFLPSSFAGIARADEPPPTGWTAQGRVQLLRLDGGDNSTSAGVEIELTRFWPGASLALGTGGLLVESSVEQRRAIGSPESFDIETIEQTETLAESAFASLAYRQDLSESTLLVAGVAWERDEPAGFSDRHSVHLGLGLETHGRRGGCLETTLAATWIRQVDLVPAAGAAEEFPGLRLHTRYSRKLGENSHFESRWQVDVNLDDADDLRSDWTQALRVSIHRFVSFEVEARWQHDRRPALQQIPLDDGSAADPLPRVAVPLDEDQTQLMVALVLHR